jgi:hypothetical protein
MMDDLQKEPAPAEQGEGRIAEMRRKAEALQDTEWREGYLDALHDIEMTPLRLASRPQLEAAKDMRELLAELDEIARDFDSCEYGLPIRTDISDEYVAPTNAMLTAIEASFQARLASARDQGDEPHGEWDRVTKKEMWDTIQEVRKLAGNDGTESLEDTVRNIVETGSDAIQGLIVELETRAESAERMCEEMRAAVLDCIPSSWLDPLLTGSGAVIHKFSCPEIEALLNGVKARISAALATPAEGTTREGERPPCQHGKPCPKAFEDSERCQYPEEPCALAHEATGGKA